MNLTDILILLLAAALVGCALRYIIKEKKAGAKCIGCSSSKTCGGSCGCGKQ